MPMVLAALFALAAADLSPEAFTGPPAAAGGPPAGGPSTGGPPAGPPGPPPAGGPPAAAAADPYKQCGGKNRDGSPFQEKSCPVGYSCVATEPSGYYKLCQPNPTEPGTKGFHEVCGGKNYKGKASCEYSVR
jgi:hypothetical protein